ncbi:hypothetical protein LCGC14_0722040 [marine sediment metagenome]|uniref:Uncharacterized protein n=1 Tax=marine sediment metagenome TaxID=412755 RepID=A0A0F9TJB4_9ZZZZ
MRKMTVREEELGKILQMIGDFNIKLGLEEQMKVQIHIHIDLRNTSKEK